MSKIVKYPFKPVLHHTHNSDLSLIATLTSLHNVTLDCPANIMIT